MGRGDAMKGPVGGLVAGNDSGVVASSRDEVEGDARARGRVRG